jgi:hypothetical protein
MLSKMGFRVSGSLEARDTLQLDDRNPAQPLGVSQALTTVTI